MPDLVIFGAGGLGRETAQAVTALPDWRLAGFAEDAPRRGLLVDGVPVIGGPRDVAALPAARVVVCTGSPRDQHSRERIVRRLALPAARYATIVHPSAWVSPSSRIGHGTVVLAQTVLTASARVGAHVAIMPHVTVTHDDVVEDHATIASGVRLGGSVRVGAGAYLGAGALVREGVTIGAGALVGMGSVVLADVPPGEVWAGSPARLLRPAPHRKEA
ncbi:NeuD/PglB/VioB family sugar acetyltransferase [Actinomadura roseirufa]|uniref:NeuD/PglB/VioB family sugar acetyltransferase n=1 Tax=Actinomadura roseirufa TaxID=2094049 RepID=UPI0010416531|nr:NeuD/PglB/VioB family sugar acetyltransferase [Actinomadura roseirufa]